MRVVLPTLLALGALICAAPASAAVIHYAAALSGASETPPNTTTGSGAASIALDTSAKTISWTLTYDGLTGPATAAHFHGPAPVGKAAGVAVPITGDLTSPISGSAPVTSNQIDDIRSGHWYVNIHTASHPAGEIRGQVVPIN